MPTKRKSNRLSEKQKARSKEHIFNPETNRYVKRTSAVGVQLVLEEFEERCSKMKQKLKAQYTDLQNRYAKKAAAVSNHLQTIKTQHDRIAELQSKVRDLQENGDSVSSGRLASLQSQVIEHEARTTEVTQRLRDVERQLANEKSRYKEVKAQKDVLGVIWAQALREIEENKRIIAQKDNQIRGFLRELSNLREETDIEIHKLRQKVSEEENRRLRSNARIREIARSKTQIQQVLAAKNIEEDKLRDKLSQLERDLIIFARKNQELKDRIAEMEMDADLLSKLKVELEVVTNERDQFRTLDVKNKKKMEELQLKLKEMAFRKDTCDRSYNSCQISIKALENLLNKSRNSLVETQQKLSAANDKLLETIKVESD